MNGGMRYLIEVGGKRLMNGGMRYLIEVGGKTSNEWWNEVFNRGWLGLEKMIVSGRFANMH